MGAIPILSVRQASMHLIFDLLIIAFFDCSDFAVCHSKLCLFVSGSYSKVQDSSTCDNFSQKIWVMFSAFNNTSAHIFFVVFLLNN